MIEEADRRGLFDLPETNAIVAGYEVDAVWQGKRLVVELDSRAHHLNPTAFEQDRVRDAALQLAGYRVLRITWRRLRDEPGRVVAELTAFLAAA
jgi:very-short-patch-repair endonuclease